MSEGDVSLIRDEDVLRRMWQQTEDFSRKKEIRSHMYRLREERLRNLYSPEPTASDGKGCEFTAPKGHVQSFADQSFQSMKSKEVRDAGSPPKEFTYRGQDLKELSNAGWNVESENRTTDDGHTHVKSVHANIEGRYDVEGGRGQFAAVDHHKQAITEYQDDNSSLKRNETSSSTAAHEQVVRKTDDGTHFSSTTSSSSTSKYQQASTKHETVPYDRYDNNERITAQKQTRTNNEQHVTSDNNMRNDHTTNYENIRFDRKNDFEGELVARKVEYPDDNTRIIVETRCLPDGTRVTSTKREFRAPVQSTRSEQRSQVRTESQYRQQRSDETSKYSRQTERSNDIVNSQRNVDDYDFKKQITNYMDNDDYSETASVRNYETNVKKTNYTNVDNETRFRHIDDSHRDDQTHSIRHVSRSNNDVDDDNQTTHHVTRVKKLSDAHTSDNYSSTTRHVTSVNKVINEDDRSTSTHVTRINNVKDTTTDDVNNSTDRHVTRINKSVDSNTDDYSTTHETRKVIDRADDDVRSQTNYETRKIVHTDRSPDNNIYSRPKHIPEKEHDDVDFVLKRGERPVRKEDITENKHKEEYVHKITRDRKTEEVVERKISNEYQTTYQTDYQKKVSLDWSPSHQAWASTLRSDSPSTTRPSTRASSPGSKTFKSSTSSLRSSVSPEKGTRKPSSRPSSRGGSPNKIDRNSPTRNLDKHSSTHTVSETKTHRYTSPEGRPPTGRSPASGYSPERKPQDGRPRTSMSPEKRPQNFGNSTSPERKPKTGDKPREAAFNRPAQPQSPTKLNQSPERKSGYHPSNTPDIQDSYSQRAPSPEKQPNERPRNKTSGYYPTGNQKKPSTSPDRESGHQPNKPKESRPEGSTSIPNNKKMDVSPDRKMDRAHRPSSSPERKPDATKPSDIYPDRKSPTKSSVSPQRKSPVKHLDNPDTTKINKVKEDHYKFVDEETKMYTRIDEKDGKPSGKSPRDMTPDISRPTQCVPDEEITDYSETTDIKTKTNIRENNIKNKFEEHTEDVTNITRITENYPKSREGSPTKSVPVNNKPDVTHPNDTKLLRENSPTKTKPYPNKDTPSRETSPSKQFPKSDKFSTENPSSPREQSPSKFGTYEKKKPRDNDDNTVKDTGSKPREISPVKQFRESSPDKIEKSHRKPNEEPKEVTSVKSRETSPTKSRPKDGKPKNSDKSQTPKYTPNSSIREMSPVKKQPPSSSALERDLSPTKKPLRQENPEDKPIGSKETSPAKETTPKKRPTADVTDQASENRDSPKPKESSPSRFGTYNKKTLHDVEENTVISSEIDNTKYDSLKNRETISKISPKSPTKTYPRDQVTSVKPPNEDMKYKNTIDFLATERIAEEINKTKDQQDHLDSSPTKKPYCETEPSTGQSSPTASTGFIYFESPKPQKPIITDLDTQEYYAESSSIEENITHERPESLPFDKTAPSKIPYRSPSPEKQPKENIPRKSSLKKSNVDTNRVSPVEKTPKNMDNEQKIVTKDNEDDGSKSRPPFERRETYEDRCRKILGMTDTDTTRVTTETRYLIDSDSPDHSQSVKTTPFDKPISKDSKTHVTDFIQCEKQDNIKTSRHDTPTNKPKMLSPKVQDTSPKTTKLNPEDDSSDNEPASETEVTRDDTLNKDRYPEGTDLEDYEQPSSIPIKPVKGRITEQQQSPESPDNKRPLDRSSPEKKSGVIKTATTASDLKTHSINNTNEKYVTTIESSSKTNKPKPDGKNRSASPTKHLKHSDTSPDRKSKGRPLQHQEKSLPDFSKPDQDKTIKSLIKQETIYDDEEIIISGQYQPSQKSDKLPRQTSPVRKPGYTTHAETSSPETPKELTKTITSTSITSKPTREDIEGTNLTIITKDKHPSRFSESPTRHIPEEPIKPNETLTKSTRASSPRKTDSSPKDKKSTDKHSEDKSPIRPNEGKPNDESNNQTSVSSPKKSIHTRDSPERAKQPKTNDFSRGTSPTKSIPHSKDTSAERDRSSPNDKYPKDTSPSRQGNAPRLVTSTSDSRDVEEIHSRSTDKNNKYRTSESPIRQSPRAYSPDSNQPRSSEKPKQITDDTPQKQLSTSERKGLPDSRKNKPDSKHPVDSSPTRDDFTSVHRKTTSVNTQLDSDDIDEMCTTTVTNKYSSRTSESPIRQSPKDYSPDSKQPRSSEKPKQTKDDSPQKHLPTSERNIGLPDNRKNKPDSKHPVDSSPTRDDFTSVHRKTTSVNTQRDSDDIDEMCTTTVTNKHSSRTSESPIRQSPKDYSPDSKQPRSSEKPKQITDDTPQKQLSTSERKGLPDSRKNKPDSKHPVDSSPTRDDFTSVHRKTTSVNTQLDSDDIDEMCTTTVTNKYSSRTSESPIRQSPKDYSPDSKQPRSSEKPKQTKDDSPQKHLPTSERNIGLPDNRKNKPDSKHPVDSSPTRDDFTSVHRKTTSVNTQRDSDDIDEMCTTTVTNKHSSRTSESPIRQSPKDYSPDSKQPRSSEKPKQTKDDSPQKHLPTSERNIGLPDNRKNKPDSEHPVDSSPTRDNFTSVHRKTTSVNTQRDSEDIDEMYTTTVTNKYSSRTSESPTRKLREDISDYNEPRSQQSKQPKDSSLRRQATSPDRKLVKPSKDNNRVTPDNKSPKDDSPTSADKTSRHIKTATVTAGYDSDNIEETTVENYERFISDFPKHNTPKGDILNNELSPEKSRPQKYDSSRMPTTSPERKSIQPPKESPSKKSDDTPIDKTPGYMRTTTSKQTTTVDKVGEIDIKKSLESKHRTNVIEEVEEQTKKTTKSSSPVKPSDKPRNASPVKPHSPDSRSRYVKPTDSMKSIDKETRDFEYTTEVTDKSPRMSASPTRRVPEATHLKPEETRQLRTPSPTKKTTTCEINTDFIVSEREQEVMDRVQKSLRKLSPERKERSPSPKKSTKTTTSLHDLDINESVEMEEYKDTTDRREKTEFMNITPKDDVRKEVYKDKNVPTKPSSRTVSPTKKPGVTPIKAENVPESSKSRSISPKKSVSERPQSPQVPKTSGIKPREPIPSHVTRRPITKATTVEKTTFDVKKTGAVKQTSVITKNTVKTTASKFISSKPESELKRTPTPKSVKDLTTKNDVKVIRTVSDTTTKSKKTSPQRVKSKPEIQVSDMSSKPKTQKTKEPQSKFPGKPKSATALNTSTDEDNIIIDLQQSKSSRENSPDRICPTPINFGEDTGTPRFPDEVNEPDDDIHKRTHHTIHETESIVDDIVEIREEDELFVRKSKIEEDEEEEYDDSLLSVHDKVSKFKTHIKTVTKPKDTSFAFKDTERRVHSDFVTEDMKSDECLLSVSEKVNKFAKGPRDRKDSKSPSRRITDDYDKNTTYQDDYTKLSVNDKAHLFVETAENIKTPKVKPTSKIERPDLSNVDESLKSDDCLLSVSDKVNKFVKTAEQYFTETHDIEEKEKKIKEQHDKIMKKIVYDSEDESESEEIDIIEEKIDRKSPHRQLPKQDTYTLETEPKQSRVKESPQRHLFKQETYTIEPAPEQPKAKEPKVPGKLKRTDTPTDRAPVVKITSLRSSEAVKKAKALFENIATTQKETVSKTTKLTDIGVTKKTPKTTTVAHTTVDTPDFEYVDEVHTTPNTKGRTTDASYKPRDQGPRSSPSRVTTQSPDLRAESPGRKMVKHVSPERTTPVTPDVRSKSPTRPTETPNKTVLSRYPVGHRAESPKQPLSDRPEKVPGYLRPTKTSQMKEDKVEEVDVSSRRGSGKFGVELKRTSVERSTTSSERRRSVEHPCIEDIFDLDLLEQMLEKVVGYEQRRRIRAQIRIAKKGEHTDTTTVTRTIKTVTKTKSPDRPSQRSPEETPKSKKPSSPERVHSPQRPYESDDQIQEFNVHEQTLKGKPHAQRPHSPEKPTLKSTPKSTRQSSPEKKNTQSPLKAKPKGSKFNEYASAYMKKVGLNETEKIKTMDSKRTETKQRTVKNIAEHVTVEHVSSTGRTSSKEVIEVNLNGKRTPSPDKRSPERKPKAASPEKTRSPSPEIKHKKETIIKTVYDIDKKIPQKQVEEEKPTWVTNRNLKKITSETRTFSSKKLEPEKPKYRTASPSKVITKPIDVITSSYGPGPLDADGKPLFGIKALRNGGSNYQVKGTVIRQEFHSRNGGEPEGTVSVTAYSTEPEELEKLLQNQGAPPSRIHGLSAITTTKKFGGDTGTTLREVHGKEDRASLEQFTHSDRRTSETTTETIGYDSSEHTTGRRLETRREEITEQFAPEVSEVTIVERIEKGGDRVDKKMERREDKQTVRQSSVKNLTEKYIKSANETSKTERTTYPKAGLILRTATMKDSVSSDSSTHAGLTRTDSEHSLGSGDDTVVTTTTERVGDGVRTTTTTRTVHHGHVHHVQPKVQDERSFLDSSTKVTGVQDILTRMKNADIVIQEGDSAEDTEARALLNKFLGATVLMSGMQGYVTEKPSGKVVVKQETVRSSSGGGGNVTSTRTVEEFDVDQCWDERVLRKLLDECSDYEQRRRLRGRIRTLMAEQEACASAVTAALDAAGEAGDGSEAREEEEVTVTSSVRRNSSEKTVSSSTTTKTSKVIESMTRPAPKPVSPFAKFRQLEKQNSTNSPNSPQTPQSPGSPSQPIFKFTDPALQASALTIKERLLQWCRDKTRDYENVKLENFSTSWADGLAFCALVHHFLPDAFDYSQLTAEKRRHNFTLAFKVADEKAGIYPLLDVDDMVKMRKPDWKCVFTYVQSIHRRFKDQD